MGNLLHNIPSYLLDFYLFNIIVVNIGMFLVSIYNIPVFINSEKNKRIRNIFSKILSEIILLENYENTEKIKILKKLKVQKNRRIRTIFIKVLKEYTIFLKGTEFATLTDVYKSLGLHLKDIKDLDSIFTSRVLGALDRLNSFKIVVNRTKIKKLQKHKNPDIRELANAYTLNIYDSEDIYEFFDFTTEPFTPWQQLEYFQLITNRPLAPKADFGKWINPKYESSIISLSLDLVAYYHQETAIEPIHSMIKIDHTKIRRKMIRTLGILNQKQSIDVLMDQYLEEDDMKCKKEIVKSLGYMGYKNEKVIHFLEELLKTEFHTNFRKAILIALSRATGSESILENKIYRYELEKTVPDEQKIL